MTYFKFTATALLMMILAACQQNQETASAEPSGVSLESQEAKLGYMYGLQAASDLMRSGLNEKIDLDAVILALKDITAGEEARLSVEEMQTTQLAFQQQQQAEFQALSDENQAQGDAYLAGNAEQENIVITDSGLQYQVLREGKGKKPEATSTVKVHYSGKLVDGTEFDSSYTRGEPANFPVSGVIPGFSEGLLLMQEGAKYKLSIPAAIAYGDQAPESIGPNQVLVFEVELLEVL